MTEKTIGIVDSLKPTEKISSILANNPKVLRSNVVGFSYADTKDANNGQVEIEIMPDYTMINLLFSTKEDKVVINLERNTVVKFDYTDNQSVELLLSRWVVPLVGGKRSIYTFTEQAWEEDIGNMPVALLAKYNNIITSLKKTVPTLEDKDRYSHYMKVVSTLVTKSVPSADVNEALTLFLSIGRRYSEKTILWFNALKQVTKVILEDETLSDILRIS